MEEELKNLSFVLDTGSNVSLIRKNIFTQNGEQKVFRLKSISGEIDRQSIEFKLNLFSLKKVPVVSNSSFHSIKFDSKFSFDGILGNDVLGKFDLFLELPENVYLITSSDKKKNLSGFQKIPFLFLEGHIILNAKMGKSSFKFLLDTGAAISYLNKKKANELNLDIGGNASYIDLSGQMHDTIYHIGENLCVDENICQKKIELLSGNSIEDFLSESGKLDGILGLNWIEKYSILIDYKNTSLYIKQR